MAKIRLQITKGEPVRYISHLDYARAVERAVRRAKLPAAYSEGFNPHMKMAFASALALGVTSDAEYLDLDLTHELPIAAFQQAFSAQLPKGIELKAAEYLAPQTPALMKVINLATYLLHMPLKSADYDRTAAAVDAFNAAPAVIYTKDSPKGKREIDIKKYMAASAEIVSWDQIVVQISLAIHIKPTGSVKPGEVLDALVRDFDLPVLSAEALIHRTGLYISGGHERRTPIRG